uniref:G protein-coupled receptor n=1 Tax=Steinernema glaseri TaxID=37863 RepID=A0A1I7ZNP8_9BILA
MSEPYEALYNRILDVTAIINTPIKIFVMVIVVRCSTPAMRSFSLLLLNGLFWNFMANFIFVFLHIYPLFPAECFQADGLISLVTDSETVGHVMFCVLFFCILNGILSFSFTFPYRYMVFAHPLTVDKIKRTWIVLFCIGVHVVTAIFFIYLYSFWVVHSPEYLILKEEQEIGAVFCFKAYGPDKENMLAFYLLILSVAAVIGLGSTILLLLSIRRASLVCNNNIYLQSHKRILWTLIWITCIPLFLGVLPLTAALVIAVNPQIPNARPIGMVCAVMMSNHGTVYAIALIVAIKPYRVAVQQIFRSILAPNVVSGLVISS